MMEFNLSVDRARLRPVSFRAGEAGGPLPIDEETGGLGV
jgi:hypothetical protein